MINRLNTNTNTMNASQRKFLIERIKEVNNKKIDDLQKKKKSLPNLKAYLIEEVIKGTAVFKSYEELKDTFQKIIVTGRRKESFRHHLDDQVIQIKWNEVFVFPDSYIKDLEEAEKHNKKIEDQIDSIKTMIRTLEIQINLSSGSRLQKMIDEVDSMEQLSLMSSKLKLLNQ